MQKAKSFLHALLLIFVWACTSIFFAWAVGAIWYFDLFPKPVGPLLAIVSFAAAIYLLLKTSPRQKWLLYAGLFIFGSWLLTLLQQPSHDRDWAKDQIELSTIRIENGQVTIGNFRNNLYRSETDFDVRRRDFQFQLSDLSKMWFIVQRFSASEGLAHVFLSFEIAGETSPRHFAASVEIRRENDEYFSPVQGLYRQYELNYIFGSEQDLIGVRTVMRPDDRVFMYPVNASPNQVQKLFLSMADRTEKISQSPEFYHTLLNNCMNGLLRHTRELPPKEISWFDPQIVFPGYSDRYAFREGIIGDRKRSFEELKQQCRIDQLAREHGIREGFSAAIRKNAN